MKRQQINTLFWLWKENHSARNLAGTKTSHDIDRYSSVKQRGSHAIWLDLIDCNIMLKNSTALLL